MSIIITCNVTEYVREIQIYGKLEGMSVELVSIIIRGAFSRRKLVVSHAQLSVLIGRPVHLTTMFDEWSKR